MEEKAVETQANRNTDRFFTPSLIIIFVTVFIDLIGFGMVIPILPFYAESLDASPIQIGFLFAIYSLMQFLFAPMLGRLSDRYGRRPILFISILGSALGYFVIGFANTLFLVFLGRIIGGITGANISTAQAYIADVTTRENRARGMGLFGATFGLGFILGPAIAGILSKYGVHVPFYCAALLSLANAIALYFFLPESLKPEKRKAAEAGSNRLRQLIGSLREPLFGTVNLVYFLLITAFSIMTYAFVLFTAYRYGYSAEQNGYLFAYVGLMSVIGQGLLFGYLVRRVGEPVLACVGCLLMAVSLFAIPFVGPVAGGLAALLACCTVLSFGNAMASPSLTSLVSKITAEHEQGSRLGIMQSGASLARAIGPIVGGVLLNNSINRIDDMTVTRTFFAASAIMTAALVVSIFAVRVVRNAQAVS